MKTCRSILLTALLVLGRTSLAADAPAPAAAAKTAFLGVMCSPVPEALQQHLGLPPKKGVIVQFVVPEGPAAKAGLKRNDILLAANDEPIASQAELTALIRQAKPGERLTVSGIRAGEEFVADVALGEKDAEPVQGSAMAGQSFTITATGTGGPGGTTQIMPMIVAGGNGWSPMSDEALDKLVEEYLRKLPPQLQDEDRAVIKEQMVACVRAALQRRPTMPIVSMSSGAAGGGATGAASFTITTSIAENGTGTAMHADGEHTLQVDTRNGVKHLVARDNAGKTLFDGPIATPEDRAKVPAVIRAKLESMEKAAIKTGVNDADEAKPGKKP